MSVIRNLFQRKYDISELEIRINPETSDVIIFSRENDSYHSCTIRNIERKNEIARYKKLVTNEIVSQRYGDEAYLKYYKNGYTLATSLQKGIYNILGDDYAKEPKRFTKEELIKIKEELKKHLREDKKYHGLYEISYKDTYKGDRGFKGKKFVYAEQTCGHRIMGKNQSTEKTCIPSQYLTGVDDNFIDVILYPEKYPIESKKYWIKMISKKENEPEWQDDIPYTKYALDKILDRYKEENEQESRRGTEFNWKQDIYYQIPESEGRDRLGDSSIKEYAQTGDSYR